MRLRAENLQTALEKENGESQRTIQLSGSMRMIIESAPYTSSRCTLRGDEGDEGGASGDRKQTTVFTSLG